MSQEQHRYTTEEEEVNYFFMKEEEVEKGMMTRLLFLMEETKWRGRTESVEERAGNEEGGQILDVFFYQTLKCIVAYAL